ncbi:MAG: alpha/beta hydrolase [Rhodospirillaceae bacterium]|nr:alpha/beta hydrolase [Rhodospirillaceae bacterium]
MFESYCLCLGTAGFHRMFYTDRGDPESDLVTVCVHGLTRNSRDFDMVAERLAQSRRVVCPDVVGRGRSDWLPDASLYTYPQYMADMGTLMARTFAEAVDWVGTSMGGLIGMMLASLPKSPIRRLVLNDVGPFVPAAALQRIAGYVGKDPHFKGLAELEAYLREVHAPFGKLSDAQWRIMATHGFRKLEDGSLGLAYDPAIGEVFKTTPIEDVDLWAIYDRITCPVLVLRGATSDLLSEDTARQMAERGPRATVVEVPNCGHAPMLMADDQVAAVAGFLEAA